MKEIKEILMYGVVAILIGGGVLSAVLVFRLLTNAATPVTLTSPKQGITCATMTTSDGAAISCWKD